MMSAGPGQEEEEKEICVFLQEHLLDVKVQKIFKI